MTFPPRLDEDLVVGWAVCRNPGGWHLSDASEPLVMDQATAVATAGRDRLHGAEAVIVPVCEEERDA